MKIDPNRYYMNWETEVVEVGEWWLAEYNIHKGEGELPRDLTWEKWGGNKLYPVIKNEQGEWVEDWIKEIELHCCRCESKIIIEDWERNKYEKCLECVNGYTYTEEEKYELELSALESDCEDLC